MLARRLLVSLAALAVLLAGASGAHSRRGQQAFHLDEYLERHPEAEENPRVLLGSQGAQVLLAAGGAERDEEGPDDEPVLTELQAESHRHSGTRARARAQKDLYTDFRLDDYVAEAEGRAQTSGGSSDADDGAEPALAETEAEAEEDSSGLRDPEGYQDEKTVRSKHKGGSTTVIANKNYMSMMEEEDAKPMPTHLSADEARLEAEEASHKRTGEGAQKLHAEKTEKFRQDQLAKKQEQSMKQEVEAGKKKVEKEVAAAREAADKENQRTEELAEKRNQNERTQKAEEKRRKCSPHRARLGRNPSAAAGQFSEVYSRYEYPEWSFQGSWHFASRATLVGDFNGDGKDDFVRLGGKYAHFFIAKGDGTFWNKWYNFPVGWDFSFDENLWTSLPAMDLNGDGRDDIVRTSGTYNHAFISVGDDKSCFTGHGVMQPACFKITAFRYMNGWNFAGAWTWNAAAAIMGDFNGDGKKDYARLGATYIHFFISKGDGSFWMPVYPFPQGWNFGWNEGVWTSMPALDINGDCKSDILRTYTTYHHAFISQGTDAACWNRDGWIEGSCMRVTSYTYPNGWNFQGVWAWPSRAAIVGDFDGDGKHDFARLGGTYIHFFISKGDGSWWWPIYPFPQGWNFQHNEALWTTINSDMAGDMDGDGKMDILRSYYTYNHAFFSRGSAQDCWYRDGWIPAGCMAVTAFNYNNRNFNGDWTWNSLATRMGDFNGDGKDDFINLRGAKEHFVYLAK